MTARGACAAKADCAISALPINRDNVSFFIKVPYCFVMIVLWITSQIVFFFSAEIVGDNRVMNQETLRVK